ncbi:MAG: hypothetical protein CMN72_09590 [Sphingomonas sp.]|nr:hypothetical protein [Sphingomonas sp.]
MMRAAGSCRVAGCDGRVFPRQALCKRCWRRLRPDLRDALREAVESRHILRIRDAESAAITWLNERPHRAEVAAAIARVCGSD